MPHTDAPPNEGKPGLREGFTTGSSAAAAAKAATVFALTGEVLAVVDIPLPVHAVKAASGHAPASASAGRLAIPVEAVHDDGMSVRAAVIKDGGDDPDATHGARIEAVVTLDPAFSGVGPHVLIDGATGVGRVTLPGLPVPVGKAAINPGPEGQIRAAVLEALPEDFKGIVLVFIEVPEGEAIARHTLNPRLGIVGGISILGTGGIVRPYSHAAWAAAVSQSLDVARAQGHTACACTTGRRTERFFLARNTAVPELCCIQAADHYAHALREAQAKGFRTLVWAVFFGKLVKQAQGFASTHAREAELDFTLLAAWAREAGADEATAQAIAGANTAMQAHALLEHAPEVRARLTEGLVRRAKAAAASFAPGLDVRYQVFDLADATGATALYADEFPETF